MAILDKLEATISVDGQPLQEYDCDVGDEPEASSTPPIVPKIKKYVETRADSRFSITLFVHPGQTMDPTATCLTGYVYFDGKYVRCMSIDRFAIGARRCERTVSSVKERVEQNKLIRYFKFEILDLSQKDVTTIDANKYKDFGTIEVKIWPWRMTRMSKSRYSGNSYAKPPTVPQKGVKLRGVTLGVGFDLEISDHHSKRGLRSTGERVGSQPIAHFVFEYRTRKSLEDLNVIKQPTAPVLAIPLDERDPSALNPEELLQLVGILKTKIKPESKTLKRERKTSPEDVKVEETKKPKTKMRVEDAILID